MVRADFRFIHNFVLDEAHRTADEALRGKLSLGLDGILADLGVSSHQFDTAERGFSFRFDSPLDMRMNREGGKTAADVVNEYSQEDLERILRIYGEVDTQSGRTNYPCGLCRVLSAYPNGKPRLFCLGY